MITKCMLSIIWTRKSFFHSNDVTMNDATTTFFILERHSSIYAHSAGSQMHQKLTFLHTKTVQNLRIQLEFVSIF